MSIGNRFLRTKRKVQHGLSKTSPEGEAAYRGRKKAEKKMSKKQRRIYRWF